MYLTVINLDEMPEVEVAVRVKLKCLCGCGYSSTYDLSPRPLDVGGVGIWTETAFECAIGLTMGLFQPKFVEVLSHKEDEGNVKKTN